MKYKKKFYIGFRPFVIRIGETVFCICADVLARIAQGRWYLGEME